MSKINSWPFLLLISFLVLNTMHGQHKISLKTGSSVIQLECIGNNNDTLIFFNLHNNEQTSVAAIKEVLKTEHGKYLGILSGGTRELSLKENGQTISVDPNRIFTITGIKKTLKNYNCYSERNLKLVDTIAREIINHLSEAKLIVAMHNNTGEGYSITGILATNDKRHDAEDIYINPNHDENDFFFVTERSKFDYFKSQGYNVVLQDNTNVEDDGSLSVYCGQHNIGYINIECQNGHLKEQIQMVKEVYKGFVNEEK